MSTSFQTSPAVSSVTSVHAATLLIEEQLKNPGANLRQTALQIATVEESAGLLFDPARAQDIADAARAQADDELRAKNLELREEIGWQRSENTALEWFHTRLRAVLALCVGRPDSDLMFVGEILAAAGSTSPGPLPLTWDGIVTGPSEDTGDENTAVSCTTSHGTAAALVLDAAQRLALGAALLSAVHVGQACRTPGCGTAAGNFAEDDPAVAGWIRIDVAGTGGPGRWWCTSWCANGAITAAGAELALADQTAATEPARQTPGPYGGDVDAFIGNAYDSLADGDVDEDDAEGTVGGGR